MKKILFGVIATVFFGLSANAQKTSSDSQNQTSRIHIEFGRVSKDCGGFGICKFTIDLEIEDVLAIISAFRTGDGGVNLNLTKDFYNKNEKHLKTGFLILEEDFVIEKNTSLKLGFKDSKTLKKGRYPVKFDTKSNTYNCFMN
jgi:hypothetical protein